MKDDDKKQIVAMLHQLNECQSRWYIAREAISFGRGGIQLMNKITGMSRTTIIKGMKELKKDSLKVNFRIRMEGGGKKKLEEKDSQLRESLSKIMEEDTAGNPMSYRTIGRRLKEMGYSLQ